MTEDNLKRAIENLSKKKHVINEDALKAKEEQLSLPKDSSTTHHLNSQRLMMNEFNKSIRLLMTVFKESNFDEMALMVTNPWRVFVLNFCIGLLRGIGFLVGILILFYFISFLNVDLTGVIPFKNLVK